METRLYHHLLTVLIILNKSFLRENFVRKICRRTLIKVASFNSKLSDVSINYKTFRSFQLKEL